MKSLHLFIGNKRYSSWSFRPWFLLRAAGIPFKETLIWIRRPDSPSKITRVSPGGRVPALKNGAVTVWESLSICEYIAEKFPEKGLWPENEKERAVARSISHEMHAGFQDLRQYLPCHFLNRYKRFAVPVEARADIVRILSIWRDCRKRYGKKGPFLFGRLTVADAMYAPVVFRFLAYGVQVDAVSRSYMKTIENLPASREWVKAASREKERIPSYEFSDREQSF